MEGACGLDAGEDNRFGGHRSYARGAKADHRRVSGSSSITFSQSECADYRQGAAGCQEHSCQSITLECVNDRAGRQ
jgi:hypothetical protein